MKANTTKKQAPEKVTEAAEKVKEVKDTVKDTVKEVKDTVKDTVKEVKDTVKEKAKEAVADTSAHIAAPKKSSSHSTKEHCFVEYGDKKLSVADISDSIKKTWKETNGTEIKSLSIYIKPEESKAYYVINEFENGSLDI